MIIDKYKRFTSIAHWDKDDISNVDFVPTYKINNKAIIFGFNAGTRNEPLDYTNFHNSESRFDKRLAMALSDTDYDGCLITDVYDINDSNLTRAKRSINDAVISEARSRIQDMIDNVHPDVLIALGRDAEKALKKLFPDYKIIEIPHHCARWGKYGSDSYYINAVLNNLHL